MIPTIPKMLAAALALGILAAPLAADPQPPVQVSRVGVVHAGGPYVAVVDGLRQGLRELGLEEGKHLVLHIRDMKGDLEAVEETARNLVRERVKSGLVESFAKPGGRLTGIHILVTDLTAKRLEILKEILPKARRFLTFYNPNNPSAQEAAASGRQAARQLRVEFVERHVVSVEELRAGLKALRAREVDAFFYVSDAMISSQVQLIIDTARAIRLPTMFQESTIVAKGVLAGYGINFHEVGRLSAKYVQRVLAGAHPRDLPVENIDRLELVVNLRTARELGLTIPRPVLLRADRVIE